jgi:hypothetical protein
MTFKVSTGLRNKMLDTGSLKAQLNSGFIDIYSGTVPATADAALSGNTKLCRISNNATGTGITFDAAAANGVLAKNPAETWKGTNLASGTATFYRFVAAADDGTLSTTQVRLQGTVGLAGADLNLSSVNLSSGANQTIDYFVVSLPTQ